MNRDISDSINRDIGNSVDWKRDFVAKPVKQSGYQVHNRTTSFCRDEILIWLRPYIDVKRGWVGRWGVQTFAFTLNHLTCASMCNRPASFHTGARPRLAFKCRRRKYKGRNRKFLVSKPGILYCRKPNYFDWMVKWPLQNHTRVFHSLMSNITARGNHDTLSYYWRQYKPVIIVWGPPIEAEWHDMVHFRGEYGELGG